MLSTIATEHAGDALDNCYRAVGSFGDEVGSDGTTQCTSTAGEPNYCYKLGKNNLIPLTPEQEADENLNLIYSNKEKDGMYCHFRLRNENGKNAFVPYMDENDHIFLARGVAKGLKALDLHGLSSGSPNSGKDKAAEIGERDLSGKGNVFKFQKDILTL
ncbi:unnamed protein product [Strongylus vulgaris]|uniref:DOMON domain-containing protein n=1 Tax=Strongylus vulgaris TaxID=40348 RepID=A0A3P7JEB7_STRVU|nr:unnamed protein product [Strongylus vulgaris]